MFSRYCYLSTLLCYFCIFDFPVLPISSFVCTIFYDFVWWFAFTFSFITFYSILISQACIYSFLHLFFLFLTVVFSKPIYPLEITIYIKSNKFTCNTPRLIPMIIHRTLCQSKIVFEYYHTLFITHFFYLYNYSSLKSILTVQSLFNLRPLVNLIFLRSLQRQSLYYFIYQVINLIICIIFCCFTSETLLGLFFIPCCHRCVLS